MQKERGFWQTTRQLSEYMWPSKRLDLKIQVVAAILCMILAKLILLYVPYLYKHATNSLAPKGLNIYQSHHTLGYLLISTPIIWVVAYNVARFAQAMINQLRDVLFTRVGQNAVRTLAIKAFKHSNDLSLSFHLERKTGGLVRIIERAIKSIETIVRFTMLSTVPTILEFVFSAAAFWYSCGFLYLLIVVVVVVVYVWFSVVTSNKRIHIRRAMNEADNMANTRYVDALLNYETVKYFCNEASEEQRFDSAMRVYEKAAIKMWTSLAWLNLGQAFILAVGMGTIMVMSACAILRGEQTVGDFVFVNSLIIQLSIPLNFIGSLYREIRQGLTDVESLFELLRVKPNITDAKDAKTLQISNGTIEFRNVSFSYEDSRQIIKNLSFKVPGGSSIAIVGPTGSGKSTIMRLLFRFYDVCQGQILIDGQDIKTLTQESLRRHIGVVPQDTVLFNDTIGYNIQYGRLGASTQEIRNAAKQAQIHNFIEQLPQGYETMVGERGLKLSGGEKQRIAIARTILKSPEILCLDEATSALDTKTEHEIQSALDIVSANRTTITIAHRLSTITNADKIIVLVNGEIKEQGTHNELMAMRSIYADMWLKQQQELEPSSE